MHILAVAICIGIICSSAALDLFSLPNNETLSVMTIVNANGEINDEVLIAGGNIIYNCHSIAIILLLFLLSFSQADSTITLQLFGNGHK